MEKINQQFIVEQYQSGVHNYTNATKELGLWASEKAVFEKYLNREDAILDVGCGTGRTTFALFSMGYRNIVGLDVTPGMIESAQQLTLHFNAKIPFLIGDVCELDFPDQQFEGLVFSFNGLMSIPDAVQRKRALQEINRVLKPGGRFIFTTHDREKDSKYLNFWKQQTNIWEKGEQDPRLFEFGDLITSSGNEEKLIFIHIPDEGEVRKLLESTGFKVLETFFRSDRFEESDLVKAYSGACRFWVGEKE